MYVVVKRTEQAVCITRSPTDSYLFASEIQELGEHVKDCKKRNGSVLVKIVEFSLGKVD